jgi:hypothetical protein
MSLLQVPVPRFFLVLVGILVGVVFTWNMAHEATTGNDEARPYVLLGLSWILLCSLCLAPGDD